MRPNISSMLEKARNSAFQRWVLNFFLPKFIPFNGPHGFKVYPQQDGAIEVTIPYWRVNRNHIKGIHACALATGAEMCSGLSLLEQLDPNKYRLIMKTISMEYHYQAKMKATARAHATEEQMKDLLEQVNQAGRSEFGSEVVLHDSDGNHLATGTVVWQVKDWKQVKTKR